MILPSRISYGSAAVQQCIRQKCYKRTGAEVSQNKSVSSIPEAQAGEAVSKRCSRVELPGVYSQW